jgi:3-deoxy-D-manno-octulosonic-acid transferase
LVLKAFEVVREKWPRALLVFAPRKPERFDAAEGCIEEFHMDFVRRSRLELPPAGGSVPAERAPSIADETSVILLDTIGELAGLYRVADAVFIGGSLVPAGGHNPLEAAVFGKVPVFGPFTENFGEITASLLAAQAAIRVRDAEDLGVRWIELLKDDTRRREMGARAQVLVERSRGAIAKTLESICALLEEPSGKKAEHGTAGTELPSSLMDARTARRRE